MWAPGDGIIILLPQFQMAVALPAGLNFLGEVEEHSHRLV
jgi:hypothetical protein